MLRGVKKSQVNEIIVDFTVLENLPADEKILELNLVDIFLTELGKLKRIIAGMGLGAADSEKNVIGFGGGQHIHRAVRPVVRKSRLIAAHVLA